MRPFRVLLLLSISLPAVLTSQPSLLRSGPMVGYGQMTEVMLWVQTAAPASVQYRYWKQGTPSSPARSAAEQSAAERELVVHTRISGLAPGTVYEYELLLNGRPVPRPYPLRFRTPPHWQYRSDPPSFTVAFGSCAYINDPSSDRPGAPYGGDYRIFTAMAALRPDLMLWTGDNIYLREPDWDSRSGMAYRYAHTRALRELQPLLGATHHYATWDDHDFGPNNADRSFRLRRESLDLFRLFWANQTHGTDEAAGVFGRFVWGDAEFFLLDDRYHRAPNDGPDDERRTMFGAAQLGWLKDALSNSDARFKVVVNGNQMLNRFTGDGELLAQFPADHRTLLSYIKERRIPGVLFLSGDRHHTELIVDGDSAFYPLYDFTSSPLTSGVHRMTRTDGTSLPEAGNPQRVPGTLVDDARNFGMLRFTGPASDRRVTLETYDAAGTLRWSKEIKATDLRMP